MREMMTSSSSTLEPVLGFGCRFHAFPSTRSCECHDGNPTTLPPVVTVQRFLPEFTSRLVNAVILRIDASRVRTDDFKRYISWITNDCQIERRNDRMSLASVRRFPVADVTAGERLGLTTELADRFLLCKAYVRRRSPTQNEHLE